MQDKSQNEYEMVISPSSEAKQQSRLDSVAFRDVFNSTQAAKDSTLVKEFNKIAGQNHIQELKKHDKNREKIFNKIKESGVSVKEFSQIQEECKFGYVYNQARAQMKTDSIAYSRFFEQNNLLNNETKSQIKTICSKIKPYVLK
jgi:hypothetical protein